MEKVLIAMNETTFSEGAFSFARQLNAEQPSLLTGVFLPEPFEESLAQQSDEAPYLVKLLREQQQERVNNNVAHFKRLCQKSGLKFRIHSGISDALLPAFKKESCFADLVVLSSEKFYSNTEDSVPQSMLEKVLHASACPVIVVPEVFTYPQSNIVLYDGSGSSAYAIRQFAYLFPMWCSKPTTVVFMEEKNEEDLALPYQQELTEWIHQHFSHASILKLGLNPRHHLTTWIKEQGKSMVIAGAYGRSALSRFMRKSLLADVIAIHQLPIFIAHR